MPDGRILVIGPPAAHTRKIAALKQGARGYIQSNCHDENSGSSGCWFNGEVWLRASRNIRIDRWKSVIYLKWVEKQRKAADTLSPKRIGSGQKWVSPSVLPNKMIARIMISPKEQWKHLTNISENELTRSSFFGPSSLGIFDRVTLCNWACFDYNRPKSE